MEGRGRGDVVTAPNRQSSAAVVGPTPAQASVTRGAAPELHPAELATWQQNSHSPSHR